MARFERGLEGVSVLLKPLEERNLPLTLAWRNRPGIRECFVNSDPIEPEAHGRWFRRYLDDPNDFVFMIVERAGARPVGQVSLYKVDRQAGTAEFGRLMIGEPDAAGKGLAREASLLVLRHAFDLGIRSVELFVRESNHRAIGLYRSVGFEESGRADGMVSMRATREER